jgi:hypothetical protein
MAGPKLSVKHFIACRRIVTERAALDNPYTLVDVSYGYEVPADREWPVRFDELWLFVRFYNGSSTHRFTVSVWWHDGPGDEVRDVAHFDVTVRFPVGVRVLSRGWNVSAVWYPGPGRYQFRLTDDRTGRMVADEWITVRRQT